MTCPQTDSRVPHTEGQLTEAQLRDLIQVLPHIAWTSLADGRCDSFSRQWIEYTGVSEADQLEYGWLMQLHPDDRERVKSEWAAMVGGVATADLEIRIRRADGAYRWFKTRAIPLRDAAGKIVKWYGCHTDIEGVKLNESLDRLVHERVAQLSDQALRKSEQRFNRLAESGLIGITVNDPAGTVIEANDTFLEMVGFSRDDLQAGKILWTEMTPPEYADETASALAQLMARGTALPWEKEYVRKDGSRVPVLIGVATLDDTRYISFCVDLTAQKRAESQSRDDELKFRRVVNASHEGIGVVDARNCFSFVNPRLEEMFGFQPGELVGKSPLDVVGEESRSFVQESMNRHQLGVAESSEYRLRRRDGTDLWALRSADPIFGEDGVREGTFVMLMDITERKSAEDALRQSEAQLRQSQKMEAIGTLAGGVAHDFNNLLSVILSYTGMILEELKPGDPLRSDIAEVNMAGLRAADLTRQLLAFSRQQILKPEVVDLNEIVAGMEKMLRRLLREDVELSILPSQSLGRVRADPGQIEQVIMNLAVNARDAMPQGGKLTIETSNVKVDSASAREHPGVSPGRYVLLAMADTGIGMDDAIRARIFEPFFTTKAKDKGTGLGLSTVFGIVNQSDGHIWAHSEIGHGSVFRVYLPRTDQDRSAKTSAPPPPKTLRGSETILLVEDEEQVRVLARTILRKNGYTVLETQNGGEAFLACEQHPATIQLLVTDVVMPRMSGRQLAERLVTQRPAMKVLYMSGYTDDSIVHRGALDSGITFLQKPITPDALLRKVRAVLDG